MKKIISFIYLFSRYSKFSFVFCSTCLTNISLDMLLFLNFHVSYVIILLVIGEGGKNYLMNGHRRKFSVLLLTQKSNLDSVIIIILHIFH